ncbi:winged helix-turn-helix transcriptional regulator [Kribbella sp. CA-253562]|uniref:winged helix-turn-helix transcriptional regulator n=1 Tax=Kribbella sp. CA-253562 TaxID=3239942 RepID=UPI003D8EB793
MATTRRYGDGCAIATALDQVGERWALLVVRELLLGPKRFTDLQEGLPNAGPKILAQRLKELDSAGIVVRRTLPPPAASQVYELTDRGAQLEDVVVALGRWGAGGTDPVSADSAMLRLRSLFAPQRREPWTATYEVRLGRQRFTVEVADGDLVHMSRGEPRDRADVIIESDSDTLAGVVGDGPALPKAIDDGRLTITGDDRAGHRLFKAAQS